MLFAKTLSFYKRQEVRQALVEQSRDKEVAIRYADYFGKRPDVLLYDSDVLELAKKKATSFHCSEELWTNPLALRSDMKKQEIDELRKGWDLILDIDCHHFIYSKLAAHILVKILKETLKDFQNIEIVKADILKIKPTLYTLNAKPYKVVANLPFYLSAPVIRKFLEAKFPPELMLLVVQKEVAQRICAKPPDMNLLAASVQFYAKPEIISYVSKKSFWPMPEVNGAILQITPTYTDKKTDSRKFFRIVKAGFSQPRKQLANNLTKKLELDKERIKSWLLKNNIQPAQRAETLFMKDWINLTKSY